MATSECIVSMLFKRIHTGLGQLEQGSQIMKSIKSDQKWKKSEIATVIFGVLRLGEKDFTDMMNQTIFMRRQIELELRP